MIGQVLDFLASSPLGVWCVLAFAAGRWSTWAERADLRRRLALVEALLSAAQGHGLAARVETPSTEAP